MLKDGLFGEVVLLGGGQGGLGLEGGDQLDDCLLDLRVHLLLVHY